MSLSFDWNHECPHTEHDKRLPRPLSPRSCSLMAYTDWHFPHLTYVSGNSRLCPYSACCEARAVVVVLLVAVRACTVKAETVLVQTRRRAIVNRRIIIMVARVRYSMVLYGMVLYGWYLYVHKKWKTWLLENKYGQGRKRKRRVPSTSTSTWNTSTKQMLSSLVTRTSQTVWYENTQWRSLFGFFLLVSFCSTVSSWWQRSDGWTTSTTTWKTKRRGQKSAYVEIVSATHFMHEN